VARSSSQQRSEQIDVEAPGRGAPLHFLDNGHTIRIRGRAPLAEAARSSPTRVRCRVIEAPRSTHLMPPRHRCEQVENSRTLVEIDALAARKEELPEEAAAREALIAVVVEQTRGAA
jgi:hypothetical protein